MPLALLDIANDEAVRLYDRKLVLSRPDQHVGWRGDRLPDDPEALVRMLRGAT
jgi:hypothetical protein